MKSKLSNTKQGTRFYKLFQGIKQRCNNENCTVYYKYGGRGIKNYWDSYEDFVVDMYQNYQSHVKEFGEKQTTIDRIDNTKGYSKENCRWATYSQQNNNLNRNRKVKFKDKMYTINELAKAVGLSDKLVRSRIEYGWDIERAVNEPMHFVSRWHNKLALISLP